MILAVLGPALAAANAWAQAPTTTTEVPEQIGPYTATSSVEIGVRGTKVRGDVDTYRSDLNYQPGFQFFDSSLLLKASPHEAPLFDSLLVKLTGWDSDPNGYMRVDAEKLDWYRFNATVRRFNYFNALPNLALGQHREDTQKNMGDFSLLLLPQHRPFRANVEYTYDSIAGPATSTYDYSRDEFPLFAPLRSRSDTISAGFDSNVGKFDISFIQGYRRFKDDATAFITGAEAGNDGAATPSSLSTFYRTVPTRGHINFTRLSVHTFLDKRVDVTGRFAYSKATTNSSLYEALSGIDFTGNRIDAGQSTSISTAERPDVLADLGVSVLATDRLTISNTFTYNWFKITGDDLLNEFLSLEGGSTISDDATRFARLTRYRSVSNTFEIDYDFHPRLQAHVGYRYTNRSINLQQFEAAPDESPQPDPEVEQFDNHTNTFLFGLRARPVKRAWTLYFDFERGANDNYFTRTANYDYTSARIRNRIQVNDTLSFNVSAILRNNDNPSRTEDVVPADFSANTKTRIITGSADWTPNARFTTSAGYTFTKIDTDAAIIFFLNFRQTLGLSQYFSRDNSAYVNASAQLGPRLSVFGAYRIHDDSGAGDRSAPEPTVLISSYPYRYQTPEVRMAIRLNDRVDLNLGYQYYKFEQKFRNLNPDERLTLQDYTAHLPYVSLRFYMGRN
jgi:hypothetical protein